MNEIESQIENEEQLNEQNVLIEKILHRLINYVSLANTFNSKHFSIKFTIVALELIFFFQLIKDNVIIQLDTMGLKSGEGEEKQQQTDEADPILVVHPNYVPSD